MPNPFRRSQGGTNAAAIAVDDVVVVTPAGDTYSATIAFDMEAYFDWIRFE